MSRLEIIHLWCTFFKHYCCIRLSNFSQSEIPYQALSQICVIHETIYSKYKNVALTTGIGHMIKFTLPTLILLNKHVYKK